MPKPNFDRYGGAAAYDAYIAQQEVARERAFAGAICADCLHCPVPPHGDIGWCEYHEDYVELLESACHPDNFEPRYVE